MLLVVSDVERAGSAPVSPQVYKHVLLKGAQAGSVLGAASVVPSLAADAYQKGAASLNAESAATMAAARAGTGLTYGLAAMSVLGAVRLLNMDTEGAQDRAYRMHYNGNAHPLALVMGGDKQQQQQAWRSIAVQIRKTA